MLAVENTKVLLGTQHNKINSFSCQLPIMTLTVGSGVECIAILNMYERSMITN